MNELAEAIMALAEENATKSRDFGRGYALAIRDVLELIQNGAMYAPQEDETSVTIHP